MNAQEAIQRLWPEASAAEQLEHLSRIRKVVKANSETRRAVIMTREEPITKAAAPIAVTAEPKKDPRVVAQERKERKAKKPKKTKIGDVAKAVLSSGSTAVDPALFYQKLVEKAAKRRQPGESFESSFTRLIVDDPKGRELYKAMTQSRGVDVNGRGAHSAAAMAASLDKPWHRAGETSFEFPATPGGRGMDNSPGAEAGSVAGFKSSEEARLDALSRKYRNKHPELSFEQAYSRVLETPDGKALFDQVRQASLVREMRGQGGIA